MLPRNSKEGSKNENFERFHPAEYLDSDTYELLLKLRRLCTDMRTRKKMRAYLKHQKYKENEIKVLFEVITNDGINEYKISKKLMAFVSRSQVKKIVRKNVQTLQFFSGLIPRGVDGYERPLYPSGLLIRGIWEIYSFYETYGFPAEPYQRKSSRLLSALAFISVRNPQRVLFVKQKQPPSVGRWIFPGGYFNLSKNDKSLRDTVRRRVREIAGIEVTVGNEMKRYPPLAYAMPTESHIFECKITKGKIEEGKVSDRYVSDIKLWKIEEALTSPEVRERERIFLQGLIRERMDEFPEP